MCRALLCPVRLISLLLISLLLAALVACGSSTGTSNSASNAPTTGTSNPGAGSGSSGSGSNNPSPGTGGGSGAALNPPRFLYLAGRPSSPQNSTAISGFIVDSATGALTRITDLGFNSSPNIPAGAAGAPDGNALFLSTNAEPGGNFVTQLLRVDRTTGKLSEFPNEKLTLTAAAVRAAIHPSGKFLYLGYVPDSVVLLPDNNPPVIGAYAVDENNGTFTPVSGQPFTVKTQGQLIVEPSGNFLYIVSDHIIDALRIDQQSGALSPAPGFPITVRTSQSGVGKMPFTLTGVTDPLGDFFFALDTFNSGVWVYRIDKTTGALLLAPGSPFSTGFGASFDGQVDPTGRFLYLVDWYFDKIGGLSINRTTGALTPVPGSPVTPPTFTPSGPMGGVLVVDPSGKFLYFNDDFKTPQDPSVQLLGYSIDQSTGGLTALPSSPTPTDFSGDLVITH